MGDFMGVIILIICVIVMVALVGTKWTLMDKIFKDYIEQKHKDDEQKADKKKAGSK